MYLFTECYIYMNFVFVVLFKLCGKFFFLTPGNNTSSVQQTKHYLVLSPLTLVFINKFIKVLRNFKFAIYYYSGNSLKCYNHSFIFKSQVFTFSMGTSLPLYFVFLSTEQ